MSEVNKQNSLVVVDLIVPEVLVKFNVDGKHDNLGQLNYQKFINILFRKFLFLIIHIQYRTFITFGKSYKMFLE